MDEKVVEKEKVEVTLEQEMAVMTEYFELLDLAEGTGIQIIPVGRPCRYFEIWILFEKNYYLSHCTSLREIKPVIQAISNFMLTEEFRDKITDKFLSKTTDKDA